MANRIYLNEEGNTAGRVAGIVAEFALVVALALFVANYGFFAVSHNSKSMEPEIPAESTVFVSRVAYVAEEPKRFDVIAFDRPGTETGTATLVRRVIGLPGELVKIENGLVYINGRLLDISAYFSEITSDGIAREGIRLKEDEYFVLGDTPANSEDSRSSTIGAVRKKDIIGKAWLQAVSVTDFRFIQ